ncbi:hypothetical protein BGZ61DRAFT_446459 [Ilyonectria robusta]|uniref:uncharacterized protein n=1 Tax=Ilyonectria robusta TaxID=1079257 RepID=UPI001E8D8264|nr:uncharacterized protein BGZ61DRAFT_446459 [Ilyonectria robusta]KAH8729481.1 hypothetical protein BGZ61DRAFT_446459 [Ilyonectria robusta]
MERLKIPAKRGGWAVMFYFRTSSHQRNLKQGSGGHSVHRCLTDPFSREVYCMNQQSVVVARVVHAPATFASSIHAVFHYMRTTEYLFKRTRAGNTSSGHPRLASPSALSCGFGIEQRCGLHTTLWLARHVPLNLVQGSRRHQATLRPYACCWSPFLHSCQETFDS